MNEPMVRAIEQQLAIIESEYAEHKNSICKKKLIKFKKQIERLAGTGSSVFCECQECASFEKTIDELKSLLPAS